MPAMREVNSARGFVYPHFTAAETEFGNSRERGERKGLQVVTTDVSGLCFACSIFAILTKQADDSWSYHEYNALGDVVNLASVGVPIKLQDIYLGVTFDPTPQYPQLRPLA